MKLLGASEASSVNEMDIFRPFRPDFIISLNERHNRIIEMRFVRFAIWPLQIFHNCLFIALLSVKCVEKLNRNNNPNLVVPWPLTAHSLNQILFSIISSSIVRIQSSWLEDDAWNPITLTCTRVLETSMTISTIFAVVSTYWLWRILAFHHVEWHVSDRLYATCATCELIKSYKQLIRNLNIIIDK